MGLYQQSEWCERCFKQKENLSPNYRKLKETLLLDVVRTTLLTCGAGVQPMMGRRVQGANLYPDLLFNYNNTHVVVEVDENKHASYTGDAERTQKLRSTFGKLVMVRINPDTAPSYNYPMVARTTKHSVEEDGVLLRHASIIYYPGEIERRTQEIEAFFHVLLARIDTATFLGRPIRFEQHRLFFH